ncbi:hypothetical protein PMG11_04193 [Penicillium brasilianum]|uniref:Amidase domain-containing protein n=1 Tax=Penicillium brasilianum TaxID=104259 RepID=A0A0F7VC52_PENBI|nr:hypothetical protein PMG11_04193 [Penicillium brasilianum]
MGSISPDLDIPNLTISSFHHALSTGTTTCTDLVTIYLSRITQYDRTLKSIIHINSHALQTAHQKDLQTQSLLKSNVPLPPLHGVPVILKDNFTTIDTPTTAGVAALNALHTTTDSPVVARLRAAGAIILAKTNLHEFALQGTTVSSVGGQTVNPWDGSRTPGGSSGGTAVAVACGFGLVGCGSDTVNSLRSPASACGVVGFRPSWGRVCTEGIVPVSSVQDVVGPMGRCVGDVRTVFDVMKSAGKVESEKVRDGHARTIRIGILDAYFGLDEAPGDLSDEVIRENAVVRGIINEALTAIKTQAGADVELVHIDPASHPDWSFATLHSTADTQIYEFQERLDAFLQLPSVMSPYRSLRDIAESGQYDRKAVTEVFTAPLEDPETFALDSPGYRTRLETVSVLKESVREVFEGNAVDALVYPHQRQFVVQIGAREQPRRNGILAALTGRPAICIPGEFGVWSLEFGVSRRRNLWKNGANIGFQAGLSAPTSSAAQGVPVGLELMGRVDGDEELLDLAQRIEGILQQGKVPDMNWIKEAI